MDATVTPTLSERLATLSADQKQLLTLIAKDYRDSDIMSEPNWDDSGKVLDGIRSLFEHFGLDRIPYDENRDRLANIGRKNGFLTMPLPERVAAPPQHEEAGEEAAIVERKKRKKPETGEMPDLQVTAKKVFRLDGDERELLRYYASSVRGDDAHKGKAKELGVTPATVNNRLNRIYAKLNIPYGKGRKKFLREVLEEFERQKWQLRDGASKPSARVRDQSIEPDEVLAPAPTVSSQGVAVREPVHEASSDVAPGASHHPGVLSGQGAGVVIPLPADVTNVDVISEQFDGKTPQPGLKEAIQRRKQAGFKPGFLVLTSTSDPSVSHVQMIFFEHGDSSE